MPLFQHRKRDLSLEPQLPFPKTEQEKQITELDDGLQTK
jgi:hypothetical protein